MADATLVGFDVAAGEKALSALAATGILPTVALWAKTSDYEVPRIFIASPAFDQLTKLEAHGRIADAIEPVFTWSAPNFVILRLKDKFITALRATFAEAADVSGMRLGGQTFGDRYVEDGYVYVIH